MQFSRFVLCVVAASALLVACSQPAPPAKAAARPDRDPTAAVTTIRAAGAKLESAVEVKPLRDPAVDGLLKQARDLEAQAQPAQALDAVRKSEKIAGPAPDILQFEAELLIQTREWRQAGEIAQKAYDSGPKVGAICARNQQTLVEVRSALGDAAGAAQAQQMVATCRQAAPARY
ncbi:MAG: tetratricopeptide repeat protein [Proteobacteria bacterium]|uniref:tetratricopeptide repeat protein n=1 Tax=Rudaea sp. TaxID=2136325 RepID=UPI0032205480|nr:tetratricopeptide repeat protein [Pseudomonadota bacterium]